MHFSQSRPRARPARARCCPRSPGAFSPARAEQALHPAPRPITPVPHGASDAAAIILLTDGNAALGEGMAIDLQLAEKAMAAQ